MTVPNSSGRSGPYLGNGVTTLFDYDFRIVDKEHLQVIKRGLDGAETDLILDTDYIVSDVGQPQGQIALTTAPATGETITILRNVPFSQETDLENQGPYYAETIEDALDLSAMRDQQLQEQIDRAITIPPSADPAELDDLIGNVLRMAESVDNIDTVAGHIANVDTVAANIGDVNTVAGDIADVRTVAANITNVNKVAAVDADVSAVSANAANINTVAANISDVNAVAGDVANVNAVAGVSADIATLAPHAADIETVASNIPQLSEKLPKDGSEAMTGALILPQIATPPTPGAGLGSVYFKFKRPHALNEDGQEYDLTAGGGGGSGIMFNVMDYGADNTGVNDSQPAFQAAVNDAAAFIASAGAIMGATVYVPSGAYRLLDTVTVNHAIHIRGDGWYQTRIINASANNDTFYFGAPDPTVAKLAGCGISGMYIQYSASDPASAHAVYFDRVRDAFAYDLKIVNHFIGIGVYGGGETIIIDRVDISAGSNFTAPLGGSALIKLDRRIVTAGQGAVDASNGNSYDHPVSVYLSNFNLRGPATTYRVAYGIYARCFDGFYIVNGHVGLTSTADVRFLPVQNNISLVNLYASSVFVDPHPDATQYGAWYSTTGGLTTVIRHHYWSSCAFSSSLTHGLTMQHANTRDVRFTNCTFSNNAQHGALISAEVEDVAFTSCNFYANAGNHANVSAGHNVTFSNCGFRGAAATYGVLISGTATKCKIVDCDFTGTTSHAIHITSTARDHTVRGCTSDKSRFIPAAATITAPYEHDAIVISATGGGTINSINGALVGKELTVYLNVGAITVADGAGNLDLSGNFTTTGANDTIKLGSINGSSWREISRSDN